jgi:hypothetical protein
MGREKAGVLWRPSKSRPSENAVITGQRPTFPHVEIVDCMASLVTERDKAVIGKAAMPT